LTPESNATPKHFSPMHTKWMLRFCTKVITLMRVENGFIGLMKTSSSIWSSQEKATDSKLAQLRACGMAAKISAEA
jgi:hypothetical protein